jgi:DNA-binding beta-propeller fold protein YncE
MMATGGDSTRRRGVSIAVIAAVWAALAIVASPASATITYEAQWGGEVGGGTFLNPAGVATDSDGNLYITDDSAHQVQKFDSDGNFLTRWGTFGVGDGQFQSPVGIATDSSDNVYVADSGNGRIQKFSSSGAYLDQWSTSSKPTGIALDSSGNVYVTEILANQVEKFDSSGNPVTTWGSPGTAEGEFSDPLGVAIDSSGNVYVNELTNGRVQEFDPDGTFVRMWGWGVDDGTSALQTCTSSCQAGLVNGSEDGRIKFPTLGIAIDASDNVYVSEQGNNRVEEFDASGATVSFTRKWGSAGSGNSQFNNPQGIAIDPSNANVYVADRDNGRIQEFTSTGVFVATLGHKFGTGDGELLQPYGVATGAGGIVYVTDLSTNDVREFDSDGTFITRWGALGSGTGEFNTPRAVAVDSTGNVYVADSANNRIEKFTSAGAFITQWGVSGSGDGEFDDPEGIAVGPSDHVYVTDRVNSRVQEFTSSGTFIRTWGTLGSGDGQFDVPLGIATGPLGNVYVADAGNGRIQEFTSSGVFVRKWGTPGSGNGQFSSPQAVATDSSGSVYVTDYGNDRIQKFTANGTFISKFGSSGFGNGEFTGPEGIATFPSTGSIFVADSSNSRIQKLHEDMTPPSGAHILGTYPFYRLATPFNVSWGGATDPGSGVQSYKAFARRAPFNGDFGISFPFATASSPGGASFSAKPGNTYCFKVKATDNAGNASAASAEKCSAIPLDDRSLTGAGWSRSTATGYYRDTYSAATRKGARLTRTGVQGKRLALVATRCPGCGVVDVKRDGTLLKRVNLTATTTKKRQIIPVANLAGVVSGTITITVATSGKPVFIDGLGISRR